MKFHQIEHIIRAAAAITDENPILILGSQSILGKYPSPPDPLGMSMEADVCPLNAPEKADAISGAIGEITVFQDTFGYYAHGLPPDACPLPDGWKNRLIKHTSENLRGVTALFLHPDDLACSKLAAGREKDMDFVAVMVAHGMVTVERLVELIEHFPRLEHRLAAAANLPVVIRKSRESGPDLQPKSPPPEPPLG